MILRNILNIFKTRSPEKNISYIVQCRENYFVGIYPSDENAKEKDGYKTLIQIAKSYFDKGFYEEFALYFMEGHYFIQLWTAHLILEYGQPTEELKMMCLDEIKKYANSTLSPDVALMEKQWLEKYLKQRI